MKRVFFKSWLLLVFLIAFRYASGGCRQESDLCSKCLCSKNNTVVNCSYLGLTRVPEHFPLNMKLLNLQGNKIKNVLSINFQNCSNIAFIDLSSNEIVHLPNGVFNCIKRRFELHLQDNQLEIQQNIFGNPEYMKKLLIQRNVNISHEAFNGLRALEELHVDGNISGGFGVGFSSLKNLKILRIYDELEKISNTTFIQFRNLTKMKELVIRRVGLIDLESDAFRPFGSLTKLDLSYNYHLNLTIVSHILSGLSSHLKELFLTAIRDDFNPTIKLGEDFFKNLSLKQHLRHLKLDRNDLLQIDPNFTIHIRNVDSLDISNNRLDCASTMNFYIIFLKNLKIFKCTEQLRRPKIPEESQPRNYKLNSLTSYSSQMCRAKSLHPCKFRKDIKNPWCFICPKSLQSLHLTSSILDNRNDFPVTFVFGELSVNDIKYDRNDLQWATGPLITLKPKLKLPINFDFSYNGMVCLAPDFLKLSIKQGLHIATLNLEGNDLANQLLDDEEGETFAVYVDLVALNLANNKIKSLNEKSFINLAKLRTLNISANFLQLLEFNVAHMKILKYLDLSNNLIVTLEQNVMDTLTSLSIEKDHANFTLYLKGNPFTCSCDTLNFMHWVKENRTKIAYINEVTCLHQSIEYPLSKTDSILSKLELYCYYALPLEISGGLIALLMLCILIGNIAYRYRWDIRYYLIKHSQKKKIYQLLMDQNIGYEYDAFVSYDTSDRRWVIQELIWHLETGANTSNATEPSPSRHFCKKRINKKEKVMQHSRSNDDNIDDEHSAPLMISSDEDRSDDQVTFKLCIHERDFEPGTKIEANILTAVQKSRYVLLVVTNSFIKSKWCRLELEMAKLESLERERNIVVIVFLEPIEETLESLEWLMKRYTYLEWFKCDTSRKKDKFWKKMTILLKSESGEEVVCECGRKLFSNSREQTFKRSASPP